MVNKKKKQFFEINIDYILSKNRNMKEALNYFKKVKNILIQMNLNKH